MSNRKYNKRQKTDVGEKRKRGRCAEKKPVASAKGDSDTLKIQSSKDSVIYVGTEYPPQYSMVDLTKSNSDTAFRPRKKQKKLKRITTIQPVKSLTCISSEDIGFVVQNKDKVSEEKADNTDSAIQLKRTYPFTSVDEPMAVYSDAAGNSLLFVDDVTNKIISQEMAELGGEHVIYEMDIETIVELYRVDLVDHFKI